mmetsp:Transcript_77439/g.219137  ORF Transcript_77439/g.219137 Transcript_77439/m.219137 type:complete len:223 (-) Transcript_77439:418-1086(-)
MLHNLQSQNLLKRWRQCRFGSNTSPAGTCADFRTSMCSLGWIFLRSSASFCLSSSALFLAFSCATSASAALCLRMSGASWHSSSISCLQCSEAGRHHRPAASPAWLAAGPLGRCAAHELLPLAGSSGSMLVVNCPPPQPSAKLGAGTSRSSSRGCSPEARGWSASSHASGPRTWWHNETRTPSEKWLPLRRVASSHLDEGAAAGASGSEHILPNSSFHSPGP